MDLKAYDAEVRSPEGVMGMENVKAKPPDQNGRGREK